MPPRRHPHQHFFIRSSKSLVFGRTGRAACVRFFAPNWRADGSLRDSCGFLRRGKSFSNSCESNPSTLTSTRRGIFARIVHLRAIRRRAAAEIHRCHRVGVPFSSGRRSRRWIAGVVSLFVRHQTKVIGSCRNHFEYADGIQRNRSPAPFVADGQNASLSISVPHRLLPACMYMHPHCLTLPPRRRSSKPPRLLRRLSLRLCLLPPAEPPAEISPASRARYFAFPPRAAGDTGKNLAWAPRVVADNVNGVSRLRDQARLASALPDRYRATQVRAGRVERNGVVVDEVNTRESETEGGLE